MIPSTPNPSFLESNEKSLDIFCVATHNRHHARKCGFREKTNHLNTPAVPLAMKKNTNLTIRAHLLRGAFYLLLLLAVCVIPFALAQRTTVKGNKPADVITVTNGDDSGPGSLRQALADANDGDTINFDPSVGTVTLTTAELAIDKSLTLSGAPQMVTVARSSQTEFRIFHVMPDHSVEIDGLTISDGHITSDNGGGILNDNSTLTIAHCTVNGNAIVSVSFDISGGGIYNSGTMTLDQVIV